jgi:hypothetical protein
MDGRTFRQSLGSLCRPETLGYMCRWSVLRRNLYIAIVVGSLLFLINQLDVVLRGTISIFVAIKLASNFVIPFLVSSVSVALELPPRGNAIAAKTR